MMLLLITTCRYHRHRRVGHRHQRLNAHNYNTPSCTDCRCRSHSLSTGIRSGHTHHHYIHSHHKCYRHIAAPSVRTLIPPNSFKECLGYSNLPPDTSGAVDTPPLVALWLVGVPKWQVPFVDAFVAPWPDMST